MSTTDKKAKAANSSIMKILQSPIQMVFLIGTILTVGMLVPFTQAGYRFANDSLRKKPEGYEWP